MVVCGVGGVWVVRGFVVCGFVVCGWGVVCGWCGWGVGGVRGQKSKWMFPAEKMDVLGRTLTRNLFAD